MFSVFLNCHRLGLDVLRHFLRHKITPLFVDSSGHRLGLGEHRDLSTLTSFVKFKLGQHLFLSVLAFSVSALMNSV